MNHLVRKVFEHFLTRRGQHQRHDVLVFNFCMQQERSVGENRKKISYMTDYRPRYNRGTILIQAEHLSSSIVLMGVFKEK